MKGPWKLLVFSNVRNMNNLLTQQFMLYCINLFKRVDLSYHVGTNIGCDSYHFILLLFPEFLF